jgi:hypothetical protein
VLAVISSLVFIAGVELWAPTLGFLGSSPFFIGWFTLTVMVWSVFVLQDSALIGLHLATWVPVENAIFATLKIVLLIALAPVLPDYGVLASWTMPLLILIIPVNILIFRVFIPRHVANSKNQAEPLIPAQIGRYVAGDYAGSLLMEASYAILPLMVIQRLSPAANAHYYMAWVIGYALYLFGINMGQSLLAEGAAEPSRLDAYGYRMLVNTLRLMVPVVAIVIVGAPYILSVFGEGYALEATAALRLLALSALPYVITTIYLNIARVRRRMLSVVAILSTISVLTLTFSYVLMGEYGITGIGLAWLISQTAVAAYLLFGTRLRTAWLSGQGRLTTNSLNGR